MLMDHTFRSWSRIFKKYLGSHKFNNYLEWFNCGEDIPDLQTTTLLRQFFQLILHCVSSDLVEKTFTVEQCL